MSNLEAPKPARAQQRLSHIERQLFSGRCQTIDSSLDQAFAEQVQHGRRCQR